MPEDIFGVLISNRVFAPVTNEERRCCLNTEETIQNFGSIKFLTGPLKGSTFPIINKQIITFGRDTSNDIVIKDDPNVSPFHARLLWKNASWYIERHPQAGTISLNKRPIDEAILYDHALIELGEDTSFLLLISNETSDAHSEKQQLPSVYSTKPVVDLTQLTVQLIQRPDQTEIAPLSALGIPSLEISSNTSSDRRTYVLDKQTTNLGRNATNDIVITNQSVSGQHLQIVRQGS